MSLTPHGWRMLALILLGLGLLWSAIGGALSLGATVVPLQAETRRLAVQASRTCFIGPAVATGLLAYLAFLASRHRRSLDAGEMMGVIGGILGLVLAFAGLVLILQPITDQPVESRTALGSLCLVPGLLIVLVAIVFFQLAGQTEKD